MYKKCLISLFLIVSIFLSACSSFKTGGIENQIRNICELATIECYYHNVAETEIDGRVILWDTKTTLWIEYSGKVKMGVDLNELKIDVKGNEVEVTMPRAKVLSCDIDNSTLTQESYFSDREGWGAADIDAEIEMKAIDAAQNEMQNKAEADLELKDQAQERVQKLIEEYVNNMGDVFGEKYELKWNYI